MSKLFLSFTVATAIALSPLSAAHAAWECQPGAPCDQDSGLSTGAIAGIAVGAAVVVGVTGYFIYKGLRRERPSSLATRFPGFNGSGGVGQEWLMFGPDSPARLSFDGQEFRADVTLHSW